MGFLADLWLPILLSSVFVFIASSILHMVIPIHKGDFQKIAVEASLLDHMRGQNLAPGEYMFPCAGSMKDMGSPEMIEKYKQGPVGFLTIIPSGSPGMGKNLVQWFLYSVLISILVAYIASLGLANGAAYLVVFRTTGAIAVLAYGFSSIPNSIWKGSRWSVTAKFMFDGVVYGLVTAGTFAWLWPEASSGWLDAATFRVEKQRGGGSSLPVTVKICGPFHHVAVFDVSTDGHSVCTDSNEA